MLIKSRTVYFHTFRHIAVARRRKFHIKKRLRHNLQKVSLLTRSVSSLVKKTLMWTAPEPHSGVSGSTANVFFTHAYIFQLDPNLRKKIVRVSKISKMPDFPYPNPVYIFFLPKFSGCYGKAHNLLLRIESSLFLSPYYETKSERITF